MKLPKRVTPPSSPKVPKLVQDLYADLRDRRLLPLIALLLVAIVAAPILLNDKGSDQPPPAAATVAGGAAGSEKAAAFSVVPAQQQLRDYRKRLAHRRAKNPFDPWAATGRKTPSEEEFRKAGEAIKKGTAKAEGGAEVPAPPESGGSGGASSPPPAPPTPPQKVTVKASVDYTVDVSAGYEGHISPIEEVKMQTKLPNAKAPVVVFNGLTQKKDAALFLMSNSVTAYNGPGKCFLGGSSCQILELKPGQGATFTVGYGNSTYKLRLDKIVPVVREATLPAHSGN